MSIVLRPSQARFHGQHGWLDSYHTFSFADFFDPAHMGFRALRVINDDWIAAGSGFDTHPHRDMEILTYVFEGAVEHKDSTGGHGVTARGDVQRMTAGTGVRHSEFNASATEDLRLLQIWILPEAKGLEPGYQQTRFDDDSKRDRLRLIASRDGGDGSLTIHQDVAVYAALLSKAPASPMSWRRVGACGSRWCGGRSPSTASVWPAATAPPWRRSTRSPSWHGTRPSSCCSIWGDYRSGVSRNSFTAW